MIIFSKNIISQEGLILGYIKIEKNIISKISSNKPRGEKVIDLSDSYIMPGIVNIDSHDLDIQQDGAISPFFALRNIEYSAVLSGVTTLYHTVFYSGGIEDSLEKTIDLIETIKKYKKSEISLVDNKVHLKFEVKSPDTMEIIKKLIDQSKIDFLTFDLFDSRQKKMKLREEYLRYHLESKFDLSEKMSDKIIRRIRDLREESNIEELSYLLKMAHYRDISVSTSQCKLAKNIISDFKDYFDIINVDDKDMSSLEIKNYKRMQASTIINASQKEIEKYIQDDAIDIITADYRTSNILMAIVRLAKFIPINKAVEYVTSNSAKALGLSKKLGRIEENAIANIVAFDLIDEIPVVRKVIYNGKEKLGTKS